MFSWVLLPRLRLGFYVVLSMVEAIHGTFG
jgi:hypothetical protein